MSDYEQVVLLNGETVFRVPDLPSRLHPSHRLRHLVGCTVAVYGSRKEYEGTITDMFYGEDRYRPGEGRWEDGDRIYEVTLANGKKRYCTPDRIGTKMVVTS